jgi:hypothetical protein
MNKFLHLLILIFFSLQINGQYIYYISPSGNDNTGNGSGESPWRTLGKAASEVTKHGSIIFLKEGIYSISTQVEISAGVSIRGEGDKSVISSLIATANTPSIILSSPIAGTNGNQSISHIKMQGNNVATWAIRVVRRNNVHIHNCTFVDFAVRGVDFHGTGANDEPTVFGKGNKFYNNTMYNCAEYLEGTDHGEGCLSFGAQDGMMIYGNEIINNSKVLNGYPLKFSGNGFLKGLKIFNNKLIGPSRSELQRYTFSIELWNCMGGIEIYDNEIFAPLDIGGKHTVKGSYDFAIDIYRNTFGPSTMGSINETGMVVESDISGGLRIRNNVFRNLTWPITFWVYANETVDGVDIYGNIFNGIGTKGFNHHGQGIFFSRTGESGNGPTWKNFNIFNNVFYGGTDAHPGNAINLPSVGVASNFNIKNNIIQGFKAYGVYLGSGSSFNGLSIENNIIYGNSNTTSISSGVKNLTLRNNLTSNPNFADPPRDFRINKESPAISGGIKVKTATDQDGNLFKDPPSIGAYEYYEIVTPVFQRSVMENDSPSTLIMNYHTDLANIIPDVSAFSVRINNILIPVISVSISVNEVFLNLQEPVVYGDDVTISYAKPSVNPLQSATGGYAANLDETAVTNNCFKVSISNKIHLDILGKGSVKINGTEAAKSLIVDEGTEIILQAYANEGWQFLQWSKDFNSTENETSFLIEHDMNITAIFAETTKYTLTVHIIGNGTVDVNDKQYTASITVEEGTEIKLEALAHAEWEFEGWDQDISSESDVISYIMEADMTIIASFNEIASYGPILSTDPFSNATQSISIYPNPASEYLNIDINGIFPVPDKIRIIDSMGKIVLESILESGSAYIKLPGYLKAGIHIVELLREKSSLHSQRLILN